MGNRKYWIDWIIAQQKNINIISDMSKVNRKEYIEGILNQITVILNDDHTHTGNMI